MPFSLPSTSIFCGYQGNTCECTGVVFYGHGSDFVGQYNTRMSTFTCDDEFFNGNTVAPNAISKE